MKFSISYKNSELKGNTSKDLERAIFATSTVMTQYLKKNPHFAGVHEISLALTLCGKVKIKNLNRTYRQKDKATDVLSFPVYENLRPDKKVLEKGLPQMDLGDVIICREVALSQSKVFKVTYSQEIIHLLVHGFLHLLGFDHEISKKEEMIMEEHEAKLVKAIYKKFNPKATKVTKSKK
jgi:probable rRNA maturation factor